MCKTLTVEGMKHFFTFQGHGGAGGRKKDEKTNRKQQL